MARKKIREYDSKMLVKEHYKRISGSELAIKSAQVRRFSFVLDPQGYICESNSYSIRVAFQLICSAENEALSL